MGIVRRAYVFICLVGIMSTICIVLLTFSNKYSYKHKRIETDKPAGWRKPDVYQNPRDFTNASDNPHLRAGKQRERNVDNDGAIFSVKFSSSSDRRTNRNTASVKENAGLEVNTELDEDTFSVVEDNSLRPHPEITDGSREVGTEGAAVALLMNIQRKSVNEEKQHVQRMTSVEKLSTGKTLMSSQTSEKMAVRDADLMRNHQTIPSHPEKSSLPSDKAVTYATLSPKNKEAQRNRLMHLPRRKNLESRELPETELGGSPRKTKAKTLSDDAKMHPRYHLELPANEKAVARPNRPRAVDGRSPSDVAQELAIKMTPQVRPITINQSLLRQNNVSDLAFAKSNATHMRVLAVGDLKPGRCQPQNNLAMMKTHKCSSSTLQNILFRWGDDRNLTFVLPKSGPYIGHPQPFDLSLAERVVGDKYNILANHARYNKGGLKRAMPSDTLYFTVLRDPVKQFESAFTYYKFDERYGVTGLRAFLKQPEIYFQREPVYPRQAGRNQMLYDLGLDARFMDETSPEVRDYIAMIEANFQLVMIAEHFEESLIILKDLLCWSLEDIVYFNQNARSKSSVRRVTQAMRRDILDWNSADTSMYNHFNRTLWAKIETYGVQRMRDEVAQLQIWNEVLKKKCIGGKLESHDPRMWYPPGIKVDSFVLNPDARGQRICEQLIRPELSYIDLLKAKQQRMTPQLDWKQEFMRRQSQMRDTHSRKFINYRPERFK